MAQDNDGLEVPGSGLSREDLLKRGAAGAFAVSMFGGLAERAHAFAGPMKFKGRQLKGDLSILQWAHFVPAYDQWLDKTYIQQWGEKNDVQVKVDHINNALLPSAAAAEVAAQKGHDSRSLGDRVASSMKRAISPALSPAASTGSTISAGMTMSGWRRPS